MSWVNFRNAVEALFQPEVQEAVNFTHTVATDAKAEAPGDLKKAFMDGASVYVATPGTFTDKIIAASAAFLLELIGDVVTLVKKDAQAIPAPTVEPTVAS